LIEKSCKFLKRPQTFISVGKVLLFIVLKATNLDVLVINVVAKPFFAISIFSN
jgi:hypothetical protein